ncbi:MAG: sporulation protein YqfD [Lachnospiraceae bacterium]|nr:sporulation protein YqfD [Lachnospiraceae bacterium]
MGSFLFYIKGYVRIRVTGYGVPRFVNICSKRGIRLWDIEKQNDLYLTNILISDFYKIREIVRKTKVKASIVSKHGLPFFFARMSARKCFVAGAFLCFFWLLYMKNFIWAIEINGNVSITDNMILDYLNQNNIEMGTRIEHIETEELEKAFRRDFNDITWISVGQEGTVLTIDIKERDVALYEEKDMFASSLYAPNDGVVTSIVVRRGIARVKEGDAVTEGQLLVDGILPIEKTDGTIGGYRLVNADADITISYSDTYADKLSFYGEEKAYTGEQTEEFYMRLGNKVYYFHWFMPKYANAEIQHEYKQLQLWEHFYLPLWYGTKEYKEYEIIKVKKDKKELESKLYENLEIFLESLEEKGVQNIQKDVKIGTSGSMLTLSGNLILENSNMLRREINASIGTELENGQYNSIINGDER